MAMRNDSPHYRRKIKYLVRAYLDQHPNEWVKKSVIADALPMHPREVAWALRLLRETTGMKLNGAPCAVVWSHKGAMLTDQLEPVALSLHAQAAHLRTRTISYVLTGPDVLKALAALPDEAKRALAKECIKILAPYL